MGWCYLERDIWGYFDDDAMQKEELLYQIYLKFFPNEVDYVNTDAELDGGYNSVIYFFRLFYFNV